MTGILIDNDELLIVDGHIVTGDSAGQAAEHILSANRGEYKEVPALGGEVVKMLNGTPDPMWCAIVKKQIQSMGIPVVSLEMTGTGITVKLQQ